MAGTYFVSFAIMPKTISKLTSRLLIYGSLVVLQRCAGFFVDISIVILAFLSQDEVVLSVG